MKEADGGRQGVKEKEGIEINIHRERERHTEGEMRAVGVHSSDFLFPLVFLSLFYLLLYLFSHLFAARKQIKTIETLQVGER